MNKKSSRLLAIILSLVILAGIVPMTTFSAAAAKKITHVDITGVTPPVAGELPTIEGIATSTTGVTIDFEFTEWEETLDDYPLWKDPETPFGAGGQYSIIVSVTPQRGYAFADTITANVDGQPATDTWGGRDWHTVYLTFDPLPAGPGQCVVSFDSNGGSGYMSDRVVDQGAAFSLPENRFTRPEGLGFKAWEVNGEEKAVDDEIQVDTDMEVKALWQPVTEIDKVNIIGVVPPVAGEPASIAGIDTDTEGIAVDEVKWVELTNDMPYFLEPDELFKPDKEYALFIMISTEPGYIFADSGDVTVEGDVATYINVWPAEEDMMIVLGFYEFQEEIEMISQDFLWIKGSGRTASFTSNAEFEDFIEVKVDGETVDEADYEVKEGSTEVTFKPAFLETLYVGIHMVEIVSEPGSAFGLFLVLEKPEIEFPEFPDDPEDPEDPEDPDVPDVEDPDTDEPDTDAPDEDDSKPDTPDSDTSIPETGSGSIAPWLGLMLTSAGALIVLSRKKKEEQ
ncbi:MAG: LPXTG cell wall anchor domain-containing protein [Acutalibacteraceae bacterium]|jgi:LPXTG-motif cell wall-anchored protein